MLRINFERVERCIEELLLAEEAREVNVVVLSPGIPLRSCEITVLTRSSVNSTWKRMSLMLATASKYFSTVASK